jgi:hypothetical protein
MRNLGRYLLLPFVALLAAACVQVGEKEDCVGIKCPAGFQWPWGGEIRYWHIQLPNNGEITRLFGIFLKDEDVVPGYGLEDGGPTGPTRPIPEVGRCATDHFNPNQGPNRVYYDLGPEMTFDIGGGNELTMPRRGVEDEGEPYVDPYGRSHDVIYFLEDFSLRDDSFFDTMHYQQALEDLPFAVRDPETEDYQTVDRLESLYMPPEIELQTPARDSGVVQLKKSEGLHVEWQGRTPGDPDVFFGATIVIVPNPGSGLPPTLCVVGNTGSFTIPPEAIQNLPADEGIMLIGLSADEAVLTDEGRVFHKWGISCDLMPWVRTE